MKKSIIALSVILSTVALTGCDQISALAEKAGITVTPVEVVEEPIPVIETSDESVDVVEESTIIVDTVKSDVVESVDLVEKPIIVEEFDVVDAETTIIDPQIVKDATVFVGPLLEPEITEVEIVAPKVDAVATLTAPTTAPVLDVVEPNESIVE
ncbi:membrane lipoprotein [Vibrio phage 2.275.O._10N.286.54.E11]|nr:membrane lipoprotein [Vibrio phage 2.275.O._10N.286.54.E11]